MNALIIGGGIAGPVLAMWLQKIGIGAVICEQRECASVEGAFLGVAPNGMNVLAQLGLAGAVLSRGHVCSSFQFANARGQNIGTIDRSRDRESFGWPMTMIRRADLNELLSTEARRRGIEVRYGLKLESLENTTARFTNGTTLRGDFVIGADGLRSTTRKLIFADAPEPTFNGLLDFGGFTRVDDLPFPPGVNMMVFGTRAFFGAFTTPSGETWWFHNGPPEVPMLELHRDDPEWISRVIEATPKILGPWRIHDLHAMPRWSNGNVCLIGDAAHAMSPSAGQGASLAMEDAMVLAQCLRDSKDPFTTFEKLRRPRVDAIFKAAQRQSNNKTPTKLQAWFRDRLLPIFVKLGERGQNATYAHRIDWETTTATSREGSGR
ncbi:MAG: FAD-dependent oxidoreductase [Archangium sp.]